MSFPKAATRLLLLWLAGTVSALAQQAAPEDASTVDRRQLNRRNVQTLEQAVAYTPEASLDVTGYDPLGDALDIRGFPVAYTGIYRDGLRQNAVDLAIPRVEPYGSESVTVLRSPAAGLFANRSPGGIVAVTTKRPSFDPSGEVQLQAGNYGRYQGNVDVTGPVEGSDGTLAYRLTGLARQAGTYLPFATDDRTVIAPALTWKPEADTTLTVLAEYLHLRLPSNPSFYRFPGYGVSRIYQGDPAFDGLRQDQFRTGYAFERRLSPDLILRQNLRYAGVEGDFAAVFRLNPIGYGDTSVVRRAFRSREHLRALALDNQVEGHAETGPVAHVLTVGLDANLYGYGRRLSFDPTDGVPARDLLLPNVGQPFVPPPLVRRLGQSAGQVGVYLQEEASWDRFVLTLGGRYDRLSTQTDYQVLPGPSSAALAGRTRQDEQAFTYRLGLNYRLSPDIVPYASYATFFTPQPGSDPDGRPFDPSRGEQIEAGVKFAVPAANLTGSIAGFDIRQSSNSLRDLATTFFQLAVGSVESRGVEMEMTANLAPGTSLTLAYRHLDISFTQQSARICREAVSACLVSLDGNAPAAIPGDTFSAFGSYLFSAASPLAGLTLGAGIRFTGPSFADDLNTARNPTVSLFDALLAYDLAAIDPRYKGLRAQINGFNVLDRRYTSCQNIFCYRGAPATVIGSLVYRW